MSIRTLAKAALAAAVLSCTAVQAEQVHVATTAIVEHPALDSVRDGIKAKLVEAGYTEDKMKFTYESAQGNPAIAAQIARKLVGEAPDVIVAIATPSAQAAVSATQEVPVVFSVVTDPLGAKLVSNLEQPGGNVTGLSDMLPVAQHLALLKEIVPSLKQLGVPYNPGEPNAVSIVEMMKIEGAKMGIEIVEAPAPKSSDVMVACQKLVGKVQAIYTPLDNTIITALESAIKVGIDAQIPVFSADTDSVERGSVAALGFNYADLGRQTGEMVLRVLNGEQPGQIPVQIAEGTNLYVNTKTARMMGVEIPESVLSRATKVIQ
ncbi:ABC transporter substrate-binding protein [Marinobacterium arenosum]|uniref:ABC transporter substrate-binding protein n=1 Tax=Marinobacterium arenosum TaxID=2862496 RepID=UPI001C9766EA|nr:ABC transporter substrate-binding protein [Marinobacterium arenosum]MBY4675194.1 ABC transporter substrate-binding protein [Marinobacterium arenosum]